MNNLRKKVIKLAHIRPELRKYLIPILKEAMEFPNQEALSEYLKEHPLADRSLHTVKQQETKTPKKEEPAKKKEKPKIRELPSDAPKVVVKEWEQEKQKWFEARADKPKTTPVKGSISKDSVETIMANAQSVFKAYEEISIPEDAEQIKSYLSDFDKFLTKSIDDGSLKDIDASKLDKVVQTCVSNLVYQTYESYTRQSGDHGVRHILGNINTQNSIFDSLEKSGKKISAKDRLMGLVIQSNHDIGYATKPARDSFKYAGYHKEYSTQIVKETLGSDLEGVFGKDGADYIYYATGTHDFPDIDWDNDPVASAVRVADNLSLYSGEKLPALFREVPGSIDILEDMHKLKKDEKKEKVDKEKEMSGLKKKLKDKVEKVSGVSDSLKDALLKASEEVSDMTPKFTLGMMGGKLDKYDFKEGALKVKIKRDDYETKLMELGFDLGQSQFGKLADAYGIDPKTLKSTRITFGKPPVLDVEIGD